MEPFKGRIQSLKRGTQSLSRRAIVWWGLLGVLLLGIFSGGLFWLTQSSLFAVRNIEVEGNRAISTEEVLSRVGPLLRGQSLFKPSFSDAEQALSDIPLTESVEFDRNFPDTIHIHVREHLPFVYLMTENGVLILSPEGKALMRLEVPAQDLPLLSTKGACVVEPGLTADCPEVTTGLWFLSNTPVNFNEEFSEVQVAGEDITLKLRAGVTIHFGSLEDYGLKFEVFRQLLARSVAAGADVTIDVSVPERPVTKERTDTATTPTVASGPDA